ncbi:MarR family winged helix-turn-helix transcriptional regulator [Streptomyces sp. NPDC056161]|uniref:MarR family winged helix-turn-helix transcriptional regulator n=1 Tax=Streptomyces sp. NPDC056161 TaxID=3345732 RepID=UPI0035D9CEBB
MEGWITVMKQTDHELILKALEAEPGLSFHLRRAEQALVARRAELSRDLGLTVPQCKTLSYLLGGVEKSPTQLSREALVTSQTMNSMIKKLESMGLVERRISPQHGRVVLVSLTEEGAELAERAARFAVGIEESLRERLSDLDYQMLVRLLDRVAEIAPATTVDGSAD